MILALRASSWTLNGICWCNFYSRSIEIVIEGALDIYVKNPKLSFTDCYLAVITDASGETPLWTLDHKLATQCPVAKEL
ncbi:hypothetical protein IJG93_02025 [Candidatus Saccharibacteria bacterium]|nr:hypothetical protein [Candidatus Saccharibacteria bacterium]